MSQTGWDTEVGSGKRPVPYGLGSAFLWCLITVNKVLWRNVTMRLKRETDQPQASEDVSSRWSYLQITMYTEVQPIMFVIALARGGPCCNRLILIK